MLVKYRIWRDFGSRRYVFDLAAPDEATALQISKKAMHWILNQKRHGRLRNIIAILPDDIASEEWRHGRCRVHYGEHHRYTLQLA